MAEWMRESGAEVACAPTGRIGAQMIAARWYDLALINASLPDMSGIELGALATNENIPVIIISGHPAVNAELARHDFPHVQKPFGAVELRRASNQAIREAQANILQVRASAAKMLTNLAAFNHEMAEARRRAAEILAKFGGKGES
jgi:DNA-binding response OmpR family regulator